MTESSAARSSACFNDVPNFSLFKLLRDDMLALVLQDALAPG
ncbi:hypothetical protein [Polaromonas sp.]|nr:hypothetical protein [Polaromonas sp.]